MKALLRLTLLFTVPALTGCAPATEPECAHVAVFRGSPYERGFEHGERFSSHIRSIYTKLLTSSIVPYLNREQLSIAPVMPVYSQPEYMNGQFSYRMLLESGLHLCENGHIPEEYQEEMHGIADGAGIPFEEVLILNTFFDTMLGFRAIVAFIMQIQEPYVVSVEVMGDCGGDGFDNDGDGVVDDDGDCAAEEFTPSPRATFVEVPVDAGIRIVLKDTNLPGLTCPDPRNVEPMGDSLIDASCVDRDCLLPECRDAAMVGRECFAPESRTCIQPRVDGVCLDYDCVRCNDPGCVDPDSIRVRLDDVLYTSEDGVFVTAHLPREEGTDPIEDPDHPHAYICDFPLEVIFTPPGGLPEASLVTMVIHASDMSPVYSPAPYHSRAMRPEQVAFTTSGYDAAHGDAALPESVHNRGVADPDVMSPSLGFAVRGGATPDGLPVLAHHYALLDSDMVHEHSLVSVHVPESGFPHVTLGYTGLVWGFSGMNTEGMTWGFANSDTLDNPLVGGALEAIFEPENLLRLMEHPDLDGLSAALSDVYMNTEGLPVGITGREVLTRTSNVPEAVEFLYGQERTYGWNMLLADAAGDIAVVEVDSHVMAPDEDVHTDSVRDENGFHYYSPDPDLSGNLDAHGYPWASVGADDIRMGSHFQKNYDDMIDLSIMGIFSPKMQRQWTSFYFRSLRAFHRLGDEVAARYGYIDADTAIEILRIQALVDIRDSMNAGVYEPARAVLHWAMGAAPATDAPFIELDLDALVQREQAR